MIEMIPAAVTAGPLLLLGGRATLHNARIAVEPTGLPLHVCVVRAVVGETGARLLDVPGHYRRRLARARTYPARHGAVTR